MAEGGVEALLDKSRRKPNLANRVDPLLEERVIEYAIQFPAYGQLRASNELRKAGIFVSASGVRSIWFRHPLNHLLDFYGVNMVALTISSKAHPDSYRVKIRLNGPETAL